MTKFRDKLLKDQATFARRIRRFALLVLAAVLCVVGGIIYIHVWSRIAASRKRGTGERPTIHDLDQPLTLSVEDDPGPSQIIPRDFLFIERHGHPVRRAGPNGQLISIIDSSKLLTLIEEVNKYSQEELVQRVDETIVWDIFNDKHKRERARGRVCRFRGTLRRWQKNEMLDLSIIDLTSLYEGQIQNAEDRWYSFYCFEEPAKMPERGDTAELVGVFYKLIKFPTKQGGEMITPLIIARTITTAKTPTRRPLAVRVVDSMPRWVFWVVTALVIAAMLGLVTILLRRPARRRRSAPLHHNDAGAQAPDAADDGQPS